MDVYALVNFLGIRYLSLPRKMLIGIVVVSVLAVVCTAVPSNGFDVLYVCPYKLGAFVWYYSE